MRKLKKIMAFVLAAMLLLSFCLTVSSCKKKEAKKKTISETDPWYTTKRITLDPKLSENDYFSVTPDGMWMCNDRFVTLYSVLERLEEDDSYYYEMMGIFDKEGNLLHLINLEDTMYSVKGTGADALVVCEGENGIRLYFENFASVETYGDGPFESPTQIGTMTIKEFFYYCEFDPDSGEVTVPPQMIRTDPDNIFFYNLQVIEGYEVGSGYLYDENDIATQEITVSKNGEPLHHVELDSVFGPGVVRYVDNIYGAGNGTAIIDCIGKTPMTAKLDLKTGKMTRLPEAKPISANQKISSTTEGKGYLTKATGIYEYDPTGANEVCVLNYDDCDLNRYESQTAKVLSINENKVILGCSPRIEGLYLMPEPIVVYVLEKTEKNPHGGKTVLTVASLSDFVTYYEGEALRLFNEQNPDYHVKLVLYDQNAYKKNGDMTDDIDTTDRQMYSAMSMVSGSLSMDIRSGDGPDVVLGAAQSIDLLDSRYLMDLTPYLERETYDASKYYSKIIDASKIDGKMYYIPTSFTIAGIIMNGSKIDENQIGFTYEQYMSFVNEQRNGSEPVTEYISRLHFLNLCFERNYTQWVKEKSMNIDQEDFREMAAFFKEKIPEGISVTTIETPDDFDIEATEEIKDVIFVEDISSTADLARYNYYFDDNIRIYGLPSKDGTGPSANITNSFSITEGSAAKDGAYALLDILLSDQIQKESFDTIPISRAASSYRIERQSKNNYTGFCDLTGLNSINYTPQVMHYLAIYEPYLKFPQIFQQTLENVDTILLSDNAIMMIVDEELPAYLLGQKDLASVIETINNRAKNVFSER